jgi:hypothetical protein
MTMQPTMMNGFKKLDIPTFVSTEQATEWGSHLNAEQHAKLVKAQRALSDTALGEWDLERMINLATQSQLMREAAEAFSPA